MPLKATSIKNILLVEDDPLDAELTLVALEENHPATDVAVVEDGAAALDYLYCRGKFKDRPPRNPILVLLDNKMPKVSGLHVLKAMKQDENLRSIPVVVFTSSCEMSDLIEFYKNGVNAYVVKPIDFSKFMDAIRQLGTFWATINEPPPAHAMEKILLQNREIASSGKREAAPKSAALLSTGTGKKFNAKVQREHGKF